MGLLSLGTPLEWEDVKPHINHVKKHGINQFLNIWKKVKTRRMDHLLWGEEVEYCVVDLSSNKARLSLRAEETLDKLQQLEQDAINRGTVFESSWKPEYARYMLEGTPGFPYGYTLDDLLQVEDNMIKRRKLASSLLREGEVVLSLTNFPMLGSPECFSPDAKPTPEDGSSRSLFIPQEAITRHARFPTLTCNIRKRRGEKVAINLPIFKDSNTPKPFREPVPPAVQDLLRRKGEPIPDSLSEYEPAALENHVYMDAMCFGMGCSCLQVTFQACSVEQGRRLYDHMAVMTPIMLALSAAAPIFKGYLTDVDCRWNVIAGSVDDRSRQERGLEPLQNQKRIFKSRYDSISRYLSPGPNVSGLCSTGEADFTRKARGSEYYKDEYNDLPIVQDDEIYEQLLEGGKHF
jgi:glutamate--cysteine ligase catalytic subunit